MEFSHQELDIIQQTVNERYGQPVELQLADTELRLDPDSPHLTECPAVYWEARNCHFVISKISDERFHCQFFYGRKEHYGTGRREYDDLAQCVITLLQLQADHEAKSN
ncbi:MAG: hypothetical protein OEZ68_05545 [Gammaproteobacteria bacterium]|nr:hypothetical protein [Gammaproteobacteria bacterium]MDH5800253.1 hypothetical protein [Gammaproteobacteria bacterium]